MIKFAKKSTTAESLTRALKSLEVGETVVYGSGKLPAEEYHSIVDTMSASKIKDLLDPSVSDYHFYRKHIKRDLPQKTSAAFDLGKALHCLVLEPELFGSEFTVAPEVDKRTTEGKKIWADFTALAGNRIVLTSEQSTLIHEMEKAVRKNKFANTLLNGTHKEVSGFHRIDADLVLKGRADAVSHGSYIVDVKTVDDASPSGFAKSAANFRYDVQDWFYKKIFGCDEFIFICVSKSEPFEVGIYKLNEQFTDKAAQQIPEALERYKRLLKTDDYSSFNNDDSPLIELAPPAWFNYL